MCDWKDAFEKFRFFNVDAEGNVKNFVVNPFEGIELTPRAEGVYSYKGIKAIPDAVDEFDASDWAFFYQLFKTYGR